jgi:hypothetical protein
MEEGRASRTNFNFSHAQRSADFKCFILVCSGKVERREEREREVIRRRCK